MMDRQTLAPYYLFRHLLTGIALLIVLLINACDPKSLPPDAAILDLAIEFVPDIGIDQPLPDVLPDIGAEVPLTWAEIPAGSFLMGSPETEQCRSYDEILHQVTLSHPFRISAMEISQSQYWHLVGNNPSLRENCLDCPVDNVTWHQAAHYANRLSQRESLPLCYSCSGDPLVCTNASAYQTDIYQCPGYRLPTEAEWEYAYRAGTQTQLYNGDLLGCEDDIEGPPEIPDTDGGLSDASVVDANMDQSSDQLPDSTIDITTDLDELIDPNAWRIAWYRTNSSGYSHPVGTRSYNGENSANMWGLYDMAGNVSEWCHDYRAAYPTKATTDPQGPTEGGYRVVRGGDFQSWTMYLRAAFRNLRSADYHDSRIGFRIVQTLTQN